MTWSDLLQEKSKLPLEEFIAWLWSEESKSIPYNPWLKALTHAMQERQ